MTNATDMPQQPIEFPPGKNPRLKSGRAWSRYILLALALLFVIIPIASADPSPWTQTSTSDFNNGTTSDTEVVTTGGGAVQLVTETGTWEMDSQAQWTNSTYSPIWSNALASDGNVVLAKPSSEWVYITTNTGSLTQSGDSWTDWKQVFLSSSDLDGATGIRATANLWRSLPNLDERSVYIEVDIGTTGDWTDVIDESSTASSGNPDSFTGQRTTGISQSTNRVRLRIRGSDWSWWIFSRYNTANHNSLSVDVYKPVYALSGTATHTYDAGHQVRWLTHNNPDPGSNIDIDWYTSDTAQSGSWSFHEDWADVQNVASRYLRQEIRLNRISQTETSSLDNTIVTFEYYKASGTLTSSTRDPLANNGTDVDDWGTISWTENTPAGTGIQFQIATNTDNATWSYVGPDCSGGSYYSSGQSINDSCHADDRYLRYRAYFSVDPAHQASTPRLDEVTITYNQKPEAPGLTGPAGTISDDTPTFQWQAPSDPDGDADFRYHLQVDNNSNFSSPEVNTTGINGLSYTSAALSEGIHWWRVRARDTVQGAGFTDPYGAWSTIFQITIDSTAPNSWVDTGSQPSADPEHFGTAANPWPDQITGGASDPAPTTGLQRVEILVHDLTDGRYWNGTSWVTTAPTNWPDANETTAWAFPLAETHLTDGHTYEIFSKATDNVGNEQTVYGHRHFLYDTTIGLSGRLWNDVNGNGVDDGETGIADVTVALYDDSMILVASEETDADGGYSFSGPALGLAAGTYTLEVDESDSALDGLTLTSDPDTPLTADYTMGQRVTGLDFGYGPYALIEGYIWDDLDRDGERDPGEPGLPDITVSLDGSSLADEVTDADGLYRFKGLSAGNYGVNPDENDADMPSSHYAATTPDPLAINDVEAGQVYADNDVGYALPETENKRLYLHSPNTLNRTGPSGGSTVTLPAAWLQSPAMYSDFGMDTGQDIVVHLNGSGAAPTVEFRVGSSSGALIGTGSGSWGGNISITPQVDTIPANQALWMRVTGGILNPTGSYIDLPAVTYVKVTAVGTYDADYASGGGAPVSNFETHDTVYIRATATDPFGDYDITGATVDIPGVGPVAMTSVYNNDDVRIFEYAYVDAAEGVYNPVVITVDEGTEGVSADGQTAFRVQSADVWVSKLATPDTVQSQDIVTFTLNYGNEGVLLAENVVITDSLPGGLTYDSWVSGPAPAVNGQELTWSLGTLNSSTDGQAIFRATVDITGTESATFNNQVDIATTTGEADTSDNTADASITLSQQATLTLDKDSDASGDVVEPGDILVYTIVIENNNYADATQGTITDPVPDDTTFVAAGLDPPAAGTIGTPPNIVTGLTVPGFDGTQPGRVTLFYTVTVHSPLADGLEIINTAIVDSDQTDPVNADHTDVVNSDHNLTITKSPSDNPAQAGDVLTYTLQYGVTGNEPAPEVVITDTYPANSAYITCEGGNDCGETSPGSGIVTWNLGTLDPVATGVVTLVVQVDSPQNDNTPLNNHVEIGDDDGEFTQFDYNGFVGSGHTLNLTKNDDQDPVQAGDPIVYTLDYSVSGNENAVGVFITDTVPAHTTFVSCTDSCTGPDTNNVITWTIGAVNAGSGGSVQFTVAVDDPLSNGTEIYNSAAINDSNGGAPANADETTAVESDHSYILLKEVGPDPVEAGSTLFYTITWTLNGNEPVSGIVIEDEIPENTVFDSCSDSCDEIGRTINWDLGDAPSGDAGGAVTFSVLVTSPLISGINIDNQAAITDDDGDRETDSNLAAAEVHSDHELTITNSDSPDPVQAGDLLGYTILVSVPADSNGYASGVVITDHIPADTEFVSASGGIMPDAQNHLQWGLGTLSPGATREVTFTVRVNMPLISGTLITNEAAVFDNEGKYETATTETTVHSDHDLYVTKSGAPDPVEAVTGDIVYTINYNVPAGGNEPAIGVVITDAIPAHTTFDSCTPLGTCNYNDVLEIVTWDLGNLDPGDSGTVSFRVNVPDPLPDGSPITNTVHIFDDDGESAEHTNTLHISSDHQLAINKSDSPDPVQAGGLISYTITYNVPGSGNEPAPNVIIEDYTPADTTFWSAAGDSVIQIDDPGQGNRGTVRYHLGTLLPGTSDTVQLVVRVDSPLPNNTFVFNSASISDDDGEYAAVYDVVTRVESSHGLEIDISDDPDPVQASELLNYTIVYTITGNQSASGVVIGDNIPPDTTFESCSGGNYCFYNDLTGRVTWGMGLRNPGSGQVQLQVRANTPLPDGTELVNMVEIYDNDLGPVRDSEITTVSSDHSLNISKIDDPDPVESDEELVYTIHWQAVGNEPAPNVTITDDIPDNTTFVGCYGGVSCSEETGTVTWELGTIDPPAEGDVTLTVQVDNLLPAGTLLYNTPAIQDDETALVSGQEITTTVHSSHQLAISQADAPDPVEAGAQLDYTLAYTVSGNQPAPNVVVEDTIPENSTFLPGSCTGCVENDGLLTWNLGTLVPPYNGTLDFTVVVSSPLPNGTSLYNFVTIYDDEGVTAGDFETTEISSDHDLVISKTDAPFDPVQAGNLLTYTIEYSVPADGNEAAPNAVIEDVTPEHTTFYTATGGLSVEAPATGETGTVRWLLGDLPPGASGSATLVVRVDEPLPDNTGLSNTTTLSDDDGVSASDDETTTVESSHTFTLENQDAPDPVSPNSTIDYTIHWEIIGNEPAEGVVITSTIPADTVFDSCGLCVPMGDYVRWNLGDRNPGDSDDVFLRVRTDPVLPDGTIITSTSYIYDTNGGTPVENQVTTEIDSGHVLIVDKTAPATVAAGDQITYIINYQVTGNEVAPNAVITDRIPANTRFISCAGATCSESEEVVTWELHTLPPETDESVQLTVEVDSPLADGTPIDNTAHFSDIDDRYAGDSATTYVTSAPDLDSSTKVVDQAHAVPGASLVYTITLRNTGNAIAEGTTLSDQLPDEVVFDSWINQNGAEIDGNIITWTGDVAPDADQIIAYQVQVSSPLDNGTEIENTATVDDGVHSVFDIGPAQTAITAEPNLITSYKTVDITSAVPGQEIEYTLNIINTGDMIASGVEVDDLIPSYSSYVPGSITFSAGFAEYQSLYDRIHWLGNVEPGTDVVITFRVELDFPLDEGVEIVNWATIDDNFSSHDPFDTNTVITTISAAPDMSSSSKTVNLAVAGPGDQLRYTITLANNGTMTADARVDDVLPENVTYVSGPALVSGGGNGGWSAGSRNIYWNSQVSPRNTVVIEYYVTLNTPLDDGTLITNTATVDDGYHEPFTTNQTETEVESAPNLSASTKTVDQGAAAPGDRLEYTITLRNTGDMNATNVTVIDTLPSDYVTLVDVPSGATYNPAAGTLTWSGLTVNTGAPLALSFEVDLDLVVPDGESIVNLATIDDGFHTEVIERRATTIVGSAPNLSTSSKEVDLADAAPGDTLEYTITLRNSGNAAAEAASLEDVLPVNVAWDGWIEQGDATWDGVAVEWTGDVQPGVDAVIAYRVRINTPLDDDTLIYNFANLDDNFPNHEEFTIGPAQTIVQSAPNLSTSTKAVDLTDARPGDELLYTITLRNSGDMVAHESVVLDEIPARATYVAGTVAADSGDAVYQPAYDRIRWTGAVEPGTDVTITYRVRIDFPLNTGTQIQNFATVDDGVHAPFDTNTVTTDITSEPVLSASTKVVNYDHASPGQILRYTIMLSNTGDMTAITSLSDILPPEVSHVGGPNVINGPPASWDSIARRVYWNGEVTPGTNVMIEYYVTINTPLDDGTLIENTATVNDGVHPQFDIGPAQTTVNSMPDLTVSTKEVDRSVAPPGDLIEYTVTLQNNGTMDAPTVMMTDTLPAEVVYFSGPVVAGGGTAQYDEAEGRIRWNGPVDVGESITIRYTVRLASGLTGGTVVENTATVNDGLGNVFEIGPAQTTMGHEIGINLFDNREFVEPDERITYTVAISGTEAPGVVVIEVDVPENSTFVSADSGYSQTSPNTIQWVTIVLNPNFYLERQMVVELLPVLDNGTVISTTARLGAGGQSNSDTESAVVVSSPDLSTSVKEVSNPEAIPGETVTYHIVFTNTGNMHAYSATVTDTIPAELNYGDDVEASGGAVSYNDTTREIRWDGEAQVGTTMMITYTAQVSESVPAGTIIENFAYLNDGINDTSLVRNAVIAVAAEAHGTGIIYLPLIISNGGGPAPAPDEDTIELVIRNCGDTNALGAFWVDLYVNPNETSAFWPISYNEGYDWFGHGAGFVVGQLGPGERLTLYLDDAVQSDLPANLPTSPRLYAQVDLFGSGTTGVVDEGSAGEENNVASSNGSSCSATPGKPDLIIESIRRITQTGSEHQSVNLLTEETAAPPRRSLPPEQ